MSAMDHKLKLTAALIVLLPTLLLLLTAAGVIVEGALAEAESLHYAYQMTTTVSLLCLPLALRLMVFRRVKEKVRESDAAYFRFALLRLALVFLVVALGAVGYVLFMESGMLWCYGVALITMVFVWPTRARRDAEQGRQP